MKLKAKKTIRLLLVGSIFVQSCTVFQTTAAAQTGGVVPTIASYLLQGASWAGNNWKAAPIGFSLKTAAALAGAYTLYSIVTKPQRIPQAYYWYKAKTNQATQALIETTLTAGGLLLFAAYAGPYIKNQRMLWHFINYIVPALGASATALMGLGSKERADIVDAQGQINRAIEKDFKPADPETYIGSAFQAGTDLVAKTFSTKRTSSNVKKIPTPDELKAMNPECVEYIDALLLNNKVCPLLELGDSGAGKSYFVDLLYLTLRNPGPQYQSQNIAMTKLNISQLANTEGLKGIAGRKIQLIQEALENYFHSGNLPEGSLVFFDEADLAIALQDPSSHGSIDPNNKNAGNNNELNKAIMDIIEKTTADFGLRLIIATNLTKAEITKTITQRINRAMQKGDNPSQKTAPGYIVDKPLPKPEVRKAIWKYLFRDDPRFQQDIERNNPNLLQNLVDATENFSPSNISELCEKIAEKWALAAGDVPFGISDEPNSTYYKQLQNQVLQQVLPEIITKTIATLGEQQEKRKALLKRDRYEDLKTGEQDQEQKKKIIDLHINQDPQVRELQEKINNLDRASYKQDLDYRKTEITGRARQLLQQPQVNRQRVQDELGQEITALFGPESGHLKYWKDRRTEYIKERACATGETRTLNNKITSLEMEEGNLSETIRKLQQLLGRIAGITTTKRQMRQANPITNRDAQSLDDQIALLPQSIKDQLQKQNFVKFTTLSQERNSDNFNNALHNNRELLNGMLKQTERDHAQLPSKIETSQLDQEPFDNILKTVANDLDKANQEIHRRTQEYNQFIDEIYRLCHNDDPQSPWQKSYAEKGKYIPNQQLWLRDPQNPTKEIRFDLTRSEAKAYGTVRGEFMRANNNTKPTPQTLYDFINHRYDALGRTLETALKQRQEVLKTRIGASKYPFNQHLKEQNKLKEKKVTPSDGLKSLRDKLNGYLQHSNQRPTFASYIQ